MGVAAAQTLELSRNIHRPNEETKRRRKEMEYDKEWSGNEFSFEKWRMPAIIETASSAGNVLTFSPVIASYHPHGKIKNSSAE